VILKKINHDNSAADWRFCEKFNLAFTVFNAFKQFHKYCSVLIIALLCHFVLLHHMQCTMCPQIKTKTGSRHKLPVSTPPRIAQCISCKAAVTGRRLILTAIKTNRATDCSKQTLHSSITTVLFKTKCCCAGPFCS